MVRLRVSSLADMVMEKVGKKALSDLCDAMG